MVLNAAQKAVLAKMPKEKQKEILKREREKDRKRKKKEDDEDAEEKILRRIIEERNKYKEKVHDLENSLSSTQNSNFKLFFLIGAMIGLELYNYKYFIKIPIEGLKPGESYTFTMPGP